MQITAAVARQKHAPLSLETLELDEPREDEILVRLVAAGVCHTDMAMRDQQFPVPQPLVLGHEGAGVVERVGARVTKVRPGDHVIMHYDSCGHCHSCKDHQPAYCHQFFRLNFSGRRADDSISVHAPGSAASADTVYGSFFGQSSFATFCLCRERNLVAVPSDAPLEILAPLGCGIQTGAGAIINALKVGVNHTLAVFGVGSVGLAAIMAARLTGTRTIIAVDLNPARLELARELGATHTVNGRDEDVVAAVKRITGFGADFAFDTTGNARVLRQATDCLGPRGTCGTVGVPAGEKEVTLDIVDIMTHGKNFRGVVQGESIPDLFIPTLIELHRQGRFPIERMIRFYDFTDINEAIADVENGVTVKAVVTFTSAGRSAQID